MRIFPSPTPGRARTRASLAALAALGLLGTGCFAGGSEHSGGKNGDSGRLDLALAFPPVKQMSPFSDDAFLLAKIGAAEPLTRLDEDGEVRPLLAKSWKQAGDEEWELKLRDDVTFHDGTRLTARHVADALNHASDASPKPRSLTGIDLTAEANGKHKVTVKTGKADPILPQRLSAPETAILAPEAYAEDVKSPDPTGAGTGPFELTGLAGKSAKLDAHEKYWGGSPKADGLDVRFVEDDASRVGGLRTGEADIVDAVPIAEAGNISGGKLTEVKVPRTVGMLLNNKRGVFTDPELRAAATGAVRGGPIVKGVYEGKADPVDGLFGPVTEWAEDRPKVEPEAEPGKPKGEKISLATYDDRPELPEAASSVAEDLRKAGFKVDITVKDFATMETDLMEGEYDAVIGTRSYLIETNDPIGYLASDWSCDGSYNIAQFCDKEIDKKISEAAGEAAVERRAKAASEIEADILATQSFVPLAAERARIGVADGVNGVANDPIERSLITRETHKK